MEKTDWKKFWDRPRHEIMRDFADRMNELYNIAEGLRDCADGHDKEIFNLTRGALYDLVGKASEQAHKWKSPAATKKADHV